MRTLRRLWRWLWATDELISYPEALRRIGQAEPHAKPLRRVK